MEFKYCLNPYDETPIMIISGVIGSIPESGDGVIGKDFQREMLQLDTMGVKQIDVFINTPGGRLTDTYDIFMAIKQSKCKVNTICYGMAASAGFILLQAGRKRFMWDIASAMTHGVYNPMADGVDEASHTMQQGLVNAVSGRIGMSVEDTARLFEGENWYTADKCREKNYVDEVLPTGLMNKPKAVAEPNVNAYKQYDLVLNLSQTQPKMVLLASVKEVLNLGTEATEQEILAKIADLKKDKETAENKAKDLEKEISDLNERISTKEVEDFVNKAVTDGKIEESVKAEYINLGKSAFDTVKALIDKLPVRKEANKVPLTGEQSRENNMEGIPADRKDWTHLDWQQKDPKGLRDLINNHPETEKALYTKTYLNAK